MTQSLAQVAPAVRPTRLIGSVSENWSAELRNAIRCPYELCELLELPKELADKAAKSSEEFPLIVPRGFAARMKKGDPLDPLLLQVLPQKAEENSDENASLDAVGDAQAMLTPGLLQKYTGRALLITSPTCAVHCRYCFRRHFPYGKTPKGLSAWEPALRMIEEDESLTEIILSGGDALSLVDATLCALMQRLQQVPHLRRIRLHTRLPVVIPSRITHTLLDSFCNGRLTPVMVIHSNHANELSEEVSASLSKISDRGALLLNQSVLLRKVNDSVKALAQLSERLLELRVTPYYLHRLDHVFGTTHFQTAPGVGERLINELRKQLPGYAVPRYVAEEAGKPHKTLLA